jgi:polyprenyl-phospho-N-acetylgalactosaminyl synthase
MTTDLRDTSRLGMTTPAAARDVVPTASVEELPPAVRAKTAIVIAAFNEAGCIGSVVRELRAQYPIVIVVDDGSADATAQEAQLAGATVLRHFVNRGQGAALQTGITFGIVQGAEYFVTFDADGQHDMADLPKLILPIVRGEVQICLGSRFIDRSERNQQIPLLRKLLLRAAVLFMRLTSRARLTDAHNGYRAFSRQAALALDIQLDRMAHASEIVDQFHASGLPYREIAVRVRYTDYSLRKGQRTSAAFRVAFDYLVGRLTR